MPPLSLLMKPSSGICNLSCEYCFYHDITQKRTQASYGFMSLETIEEVIKKSLTFADEYCSFGFQGGEPTLIGLPFFEKVIELEKKYNTKNVKIYNALQTNGYQLSEEWAKFFAKNNFLIGLSIDGTIHTHDIYRKTANDTGSFAEIMETARLFKKYQVEFNILTVVNKKTALAIKKIYRFFEKNQLQYLQFIPCLDPLDEPAGQHEYSLTPEIYGQFLCDLFDLWYEDITHGKPVFIRQFENYVGMLNGYHPESCDMNGFCSIQHIIEADGSVYPCDFFVLDSYRLGNLNTDDFPDLHQKAKELAFIENSVVRSDKCRNCNFFALCRGGCRRHRLMYGDDSLEHNYFCESYQMFFQHALPRLRRLAAMNR